MVTLQYQKEYFKREAAINNVSYIPSNDFPDTNLKCLLHFWIKGF